MDGDAQTLSVELVDFLRTLTGALAEWRGRPDALGAWLDLAMETCGPQRASTIWTEAELSRRWAPGWSDVKVRWWLNNAQKLGLMKDSGNARWEVTLPDHPLSKESSEGLELTVHQPDGSPDHDAEFAARIAERIVAQLPALRAVEQLLSRTNVIRAIRGPSIDFDLEEMLSLEAVERAYVTFVLSAVQRNKTTAAKHLGIDPSTLYRKLNKWGIE